MTVLSTWKSVVLPLSRQSSTTKHYNFGIEIEAVGKPYGGGESFTNADWYRQLAQKLRNRGIQAIHDDCSRYSKHPEYYGGKWFVTRDGSLKRPRPYVCMEVVSPRLDTTLHLSRILSEFWEAMSVHFNPQRDLSCGGHVHVTPVSSRNRFMLGALKRIAFAAVVYEDFVSAVQPVSRRDNPFCQPNSRGSADSGLRQTLLRWGNGAKSIVALRRVAADIKGMATEADLCRYMQGNRYVMWNFQNTFPHPKTGRCTGTVEFRGGSQFVSTKGTMAWVAFVLAFITLALHEDLLKKFIKFTSQSDPGFTAAVEKWWKRIRKAAGKSRMGRYLPDDFRKMASI